MSLKMDNGQAKGGPNEMMSLGIRWLPSEEIEPRRGYHFWRRPSLGEGGPREMMRARAKMFLERRWPGTLPQGLILGKEKVGSKN
jgi:hypothetical protein